MKQAIKWKQLNEKEIGDVKFKGLSITPEFEGTTLKSIIIARGFDTFKISYESYSSLRFYQQEHPKEYRPQFVFDDKTVMQINKVFLDKDEAEEYGNQLAKKLDSRNFSHVEVIELGTYSDLEKAAKKTFDTSELPF